MAFLKPVSSLVISSLDINALTALGVLLNLLLEPSLDRIDDLLVSRSADEADSNALGSETTSTTNTVKVGVSTLSERLLCLWVDVFGGRLWHVIVDGEVDTLNVNTTAEHVRADTNTLVVVLEGLVTLDAVALMSFGSTSRLDLNLPLLLAYPGVHSNGWEVALAQKTVQLGSTESALDEDDDLIVGQGVEEVVELSVLLLLAALDVVLLQTVQGKLGLVVDVDFERTLHEFLADRTGGLRQGGRKHHDLLLRRRCAEDLLDIAAHVWIIVSHDIVT